MISDLSICRDYSQLIGYKLNPDMSIAVQNSLFQEYIVNLKNYIKNNNLSEKLFRFQYVFMKEIHNKNINFINSISKMNINEIKHLCS